MNRSVRERGRGFYAGPSRSQWLRGRCDAALGLARDAMGFMTRAYHDHGPVEEVAIPGRTITVAPTMAPDAVVRVGVGCPATDQAGHPRPTPCTLGALARGF